MSTFFGVRTARLCITMVLLSCLLFCSWAPEQAHAAQLQNRGLTMSADFPGEPAVHKFSFQYATVGAVGSVLLEYCTSPVDGVPCDAPAGLDASGAFLQQQTGETGFSVASTNQNQILLTRTPTIANQTLSTYTFGNVINPTTAAGTFYGRIYTFASIDGSGAFTDFGGWAASTALNIAINSVVPPLLFFCVGVTITGTDCSTATGNFIDLGNLSPATVSSGTSQMVAATNGGGGLAIVADGITMTSGNNVIPSLPAPTVSAPGNAQFGFNLRANTNPADGQEPSGTGIVAPTAAYNTPNRYTFNPGDTVAGSATVSDFRKLTSTYIVNVPPNQAAGVYTSTITYICTASF